MCLLLVKGLNVEVVPSNFDENLHKSAFDCPSDYVKETALQKALSVAQMLRNEAVSIMFMRSHVGNSFFINYAVHCHVVD